MKDPFPFASLSAKQTVIVGELLRDHPNGRIEIDDGKPVFVSEPGESPLRIPLSEMRGGSQAGNSGKSETQDV